MIIKNYKKSENAVVGIVASFLIVGLIVAVLAVVQTQYVPKWMREKEADHMSQVADQFSQLKYSIDLHRNNREKNTPISTTFKLGSREMPYLMSVRSFGSLKILPGSFNFTINNQTDKYSFLTGAIKYKSFNSYYIDQDFIFEAGSTIIDQINGNTIYIRPSNFVVKFEDKLRIYYNLTNIVTIGNKDESVHGYGSVSIQTEYLSTFKYQVIRTVSNITLDTNYTNAWVNLMNSTFLKSGLNYGGYGTNYTIKIKDSLITVDFQDNVEVELYLNVINIGAQIGPGIIEY